MNLDDREKRRYKARNTTNNKATQGYKTPYQTKEDYSKLFQIHTRQGHKRPHTANVPQKITLWPQRAFWTSCLSQILQEIFFVSLHILCSIFFPQRIFFCYIAKNFCSFQKESMPTTRTTTKLLLGPLSVARGQKCFSV